MTAQLRAVAYGGGVQSTALLVLAATGRIDYPTFLFCNVGDDSEDPATLDYVEHQAKPFATAHGIALHEIRHVRRDGTEETLYGRLTREGSRSLPIPVRMPDTGAPGTRSCTADFKIRVIAKWLKANGASAGSPATVGIGISLDEIHRAARRRQEPHERVEYPLLDHMPPLRRSDCAQIIQQAGLPIPPKSSCWFCPYHRPQTWAEMRRDRPELFRRSCDLETLLNERRDALGRDRVYLTRFGRPLADAVAEAQDALWIDDEAYCDEGVCFV